MISIKTYIKYDIIPQIYRMIYKCGKRNDAKYVPVLAFHWFVTADEKEKELYKNNRWYSSIDLFEEQIKWLINNNYTFVSIERFCDWMIRGTNLPPKSVLLTFDDGEKSQLELVEPILKKYDIHGCCFVIGNFYYGERAEIPQDAITDDIEYFTKEDYESRDNNHLQLCSHTFNLHYKTDSCSAIKLVSDDEVIKDLSKMKSDLFMGIALPYGDYSVNTVNIVNKFYEVAFTIDRVGCPYAKKGKNRYYINRIIVDGNATSDTLRKYL